MPTTVEDDSSSFSTTPHQNITNNNHVDILSLCSSRNGNDGDGGGNISCSSSGGGGGGNNSNNNHNYNNHNNDENVGAQHYNNHSQHLQQSPSSSTSVPFRHNSSSNTNKPNQFDNHEISTCSNYGESTHLSDEYSMQNDVHLFHPAAQCSYLNGLECDLCGRLCLHPHDLEQQRQHREDCLREHEREMELSFAVQRSKDKVCGICMDTVVEKKPITSSRFGILEKCNHIFCLDCIRKWRGTKQFETRTIR